MCSESVRLGFFRLNDIKSNSRWIPDAQLPFIHIHDWILISSFKLLFHVFHSIAHTIGTFGPKPSYFNINPNAWDCLNEDFIKSLSPDTPAPHGSLDILNERISILGEIICGVCYQRLVSCLLRSPAHNLDMPLLSGSSGLLSFSSIQDWGMRGTYGSRNKNWSPTITPPKFNTWDQLLVSSLPSASCWGRSLQVSSLPSECSFSSARSNVSGAQKEKIAYKQIFPDRSRLGW